VTFAVGQEGREFSKVLLSGKCGTVWA